MYTYTQGFYIKKIGSKRTKLTSKQIVNLCENLTHTLGDGWIVTPEIGTMEGGLIFFNNKYPGYKCLRFRNNTTRWVDVNSDTIEKWRNMEDIVVVTGSSVDKYRISTWLVAVNGSPCWKHEELVILEKAFNDIGYRKVGKYPKYLNVV